jgi:RimJ/RimL family protein N-acetyltransferase
MPTIETERLILRDFVKLAAIPHRDAYDWTITLRSNGLLIGWLILGRSRHAREPGMRDCGCGYALHQHCWGQGYMPEALQAAFPYAFTVLGTQRIHAECEIENTASARVMQKCGMQYEGTIYDDDGLGNWAYRYRYVITAQTEKMF